MPSLIISVQDDGSVMVAGIEPTPDMLQGAKSFASIAEATQAIAEALEPQGQEQGQDPTTGQNPSMPAQATASPAPQGGEGMDALVEGFSRAKKGY